MDCAILHAAKRNVVENIGEAILCDFCKLVVKLVQSIFQSSISEDFIADVVAEACEKCEFQDDYICKNIVQEFKVCCGWRSMFALVV